MEFAVKKLHDWAARNIQDGIRLKQLARGVVVTCEVAEGHFEMKIAVVPIVPVESITVQLDPSKFVDDTTDRMTFRDLGM